LNAYFDSDALQKADMESDNRRSLNHRNFQERRSGDKSDQPFVNDDGMVVIDRRSEMERRTQFHYPELKHNLFSA
jgi:hypothetical protein